MGKGIDILLFKKNYFKNSYIVNRTVKHLCIHVITASMILIKLTIILQ